MFKWLLAWGIYDCDLELNKTTYYQFLVVLELTKGYGADFWQVRLNNNRIGNEIWADHKTEEGQKLDSILDRTKVAKKFF